MSNPTTPFGWQMPENTDLVTDLPADFEVFGQAVATDLQYLLGGTTGQILAKSSATDLDFDWVTDATGMTNPMTTTGDSIYSSSGSTPARLGIGSTGNVLTVAGGLPTWAAPAGGGMTLLSTTTLSGSSTSISITPTGYNAIQVTISGQTNSQNGNLFVSINNDTTSANYATAFNGVDNNIYYSGGSAGVAGVSLFLPGVAGFLGSNTASFCQLLIYDPNGSTKKLINASSAFLSSGSTNAASNTVVNYSTTSALSSIQVKTSQGSFGAGTVLVYGVK